MTVHFASENAGYEAIRKWLSDRCAIHYPEHKRELLNQRLARVQRSFAISDLNELARAVIQRDRHDVQLAVMHAASTNHTYFFREQDVLTTFRQSILPDLAARGDIRLWSAACSTGDELYTVAILIAEQLGMSALAKTQILGTDISAPVIERAESGLLDARHLEHTPAAIKAKYMRPMGIGQFQVIPEIRAVCTFRRMNLKTAPYPFKHPFQAVFCRNVLYYFSPEDQAATINAIADVTEPKGWLITSVTENIRDLSARWAQVSPGIYRKTGVM